MVEVRTENWLMEDLPSQQSPQYSNEMSCGLSATMQTSTQQRQLVRHCLFIAKESFDAGS